MYDLMWKLGDAIIWLSRLIAKRSAGKDKGKVDAIVG